MQSHEIRSRFLEFFRKRGHVIIPSAPLVPENDPSVLFNTAGMQPLVPYLLGNPHPEGAYLVNVQKCVRTTDIEEIGDNTHATFFEMLGNWSLGAYFKKEAIEWSYEFLTSEKEGLGLDPARLYITVFGGNADAPRDDESYGIWKNIFDTAKIPGERIYYMSTTPLGKEPNWWSAGDNGPCGPDTEMFYDVTGTLAAGMTQAEYLAADDRQDVVEIWNDVFMEYEKKDGQVIGKLKQKNVDTGAGLERVTMVIQGKNNIFDTDLLAPLVVLIDGERRKRPHTVFTDLPDDDVNRRSWEKRNRILADHLRTSAFLIADGVVPSNKERGYILRRLLRRTMGEDGINEFAPAVFTLLEQKYQLIYPAVSANAINEAYQQESKVFLTNAKRGFQEIVKKYIEGGGSLPRGTVFGQDAFYYFSTFGITEEAFLDTLENEVKSRVWELSSSFDAEYETAFKNHQEISRQGSEQKFKGGLADHSEKVTMLHTATHLMLAGLRKYLGDHIHQAGSNITEERTRFDFTHSEKVPREVLDKVETYVNDAIAKGCGVTIEQMPKDEAKKRGVEGSFWEKYPEIVNVYAVRASDGTVYSKELCGGPHVEDTDTIVGTFKIIKEEASSAGVRRIKAILE